MTGAFATAHGWSAGGGPFSVLPLVGFALGLTLLRVALRASLGPGSIAASILLGTVFWLLADAWGVTLAFAGFVAVGAVVGAVLRSGRAGASDRRPD